MTTSIRRRLDSVRMNSLIRSSLALMSGSIFAQVVILATSPVLTRVFGFEDFGGLANYNAWVSFLALLGCLRYEHAIIVAKDDESRGRAVVLAASLAVASSCIYVIVAALIDSSSPEQGYLRDILGIVLLIPIGVFFANLSSILNQLSIRSGLFRELAMVAGVQAVFTVSVQVGLGLLGTENGIIVGALAGSVVYAIVMAGILWRGHAFSGIRDALTLSSLRRTAREYVNFPRFALGADALGLVTLSFTPVLLSAVFNPAAAGIFAFAVRVVRLPLLVISTAIAGVLRKEGIEHLKQTGSLAALYKSIVTTLLAVGLVPCMAVMIWGPQIFAVVFGEQWSEAGRVVQILSPGILLEFVAFPLSTFYLITDSQRIALKLQLAGALLLFGAIVVGGTVLADFTQTCVLVSASMVIVNLASIVLAWRVATVRRGMQSDARGGSDAR